MDREIMEQKRIWMWSVPRSLSTAFMRCMLSRQSCKIHVDISYWTYYLSSDRVSQRFPDTPDIEGATFLENKKKLEAPHSDFSEVFVKDQAYRFRQFLVDGTIGEVLPQGYTHTFIIRHPTRAGSSLYKVLIRDSIYGSAQIEKEAASYEEIYLMHKYVTEELGQKSVIVDADDLQTDPEGSLRRYCSAVGIDYQDSMLKWRPLSEEERHEHFEGEYTVVWYGNAMTSYGIVKKTPSALPDVTNLPQDVRDVINDAMPFYEKLYEKRLKKAA